jgi:hypothetical protein
MITSFVADVLRPYYTEQFASQQERGPDVSAFGGHRLATRLISAWFGYVIVPTLGCPPAPARQAGLKKTKANFALGPRLKKA